MTLSHFLIQDISNAFEVDIRIVPSTAEKDISFTNTVEGININFLRFMNCYLGKLASYLKNEDKKILKPQFTNNGEFDQVL